MGVSTPSFAERPHLTRVGAHSTRHITMTAALLGAACLLAMVESIMPPVVGVPWLRLGLANAAVVVALLVVGRRAAFAVSGGRVLLAAVFGGTFAGPVFAMSVSGATASLLVMWLLSKRPGLTAVGWSAAGAVAHVAGQFFLAAVLLSSPWLLTLFPASALVALAFGALVGHLAMVVVSRLPAQWSFRG